MLCIVGLNFCPFLKFHFVHTDEQYYALLEFYSVYIISISWFIGCMILLLDQFTLDG